MKLTITREEIHQWIYVFGLALLVFCLPLSRYLLSISQFVLALNWLAEGNFRKKATVIQQKPSILFFASVFVVYGLGFLFSANADIGLDKVINALPLLVFPLIIGTSAPLDRKTVKWLLILFSDAVMTAAMVCLIKYLSITSATAGDFRKLSFFMPHIRFSLLIVMAIFNLLYLTFYKRYKSGQSEKTMFFVSALLLIAFLFYLRSATGIIIFVGLSMAFLLNLARRSRRSFVRYGFLVIVAGSFLTMVAYTAYTYHHNFSPGPVDYAMLDKNTANGNPYTHEPDSILENGHYAGLYICEPELKRGWNKISRIPYDSLDLRGQPLHATLNRYLTSKGLRKDSASITSLSSADIHQIEKGLANYKFGDKPGLNQRMYETLWEVQLLNRKGYVYQHSFGQRVAFLKLAGDVMKHHWMTGTGSGDVYVSMLSRSKINNLSVDPLWEGKPHNQFVFFMLAFGIPGFLWIIFCWIVPVIASKAYHILLFNLFAGIMLISMFTLDTLESYDSIVFFTFFYSLFVFGVSIPDTKKA